MAYYKRNGFALAGQGQEHSHHDNTVKDVKYGSELEINATLINVIAERVLALLESRIDPMQDDTVKSKVKSFTVKEKQATMETGCPVEFEGISAMYSNVGVKDDTEATVKCDDEINVKHTSQHSQNHINTQKLSRKRLRKKAEYFTETLTNNQSIEEIDFTAAENNFDNLSELLEPAPEINKEGIPGTDSPIDQEPEVDNSANENQPYEWIESTFLKRIEGKMSINTGDLEKYQIMHQEGRKVLECLKCLFKTTLVLSNFTVISRPTFMQFIETFSKVVQSTQFQKLPKHFPYHALALEMEQMLHTLALEGRHKRTFRLRLSPDRKAQLIAVGFEMRDVQDKKFNSISFIETDTNP
jgi:hypothetical protein